jgi:hypothetical protein
MNAIGQQIDYVAKMSNMVMQKRRIARQKNLAMEPYNTPPEGNAPFNEVGSVDGPGTAGSTPILLSFIVPQGWDGVIRHIINEYTGNNFINNSDQLVWALRVNGLYIKGYQNIQSQFTGSTNGATITPGILVKSGQLIEIICSVDPVFVPSGGSQIIAGVDGFYYPSGIARTN